MVGTSVREGNSWPFIAKMTDSAQRANRYPPTPPRKESGRRTMQIESVATNAGVATSAPHRESPVAGPAHLQVTVVVLDLDRRASREFPPPAPTSERHDVQRLVQRVKHADGDQDRQRNRGGHDQRASPGRRTSGSSAP